MATHPQTPIPELLQQQRDELKARFGVRRLAVSGSASRDELTADSDVDLLVEFEGKATFARFMDLKFFLEDLLGRPVDDERAPPEARTNNHAIRPTWTHEFNSADDIDPNIPKY